MTTPIETMIEAALRPIEGAVPSADGMPYATHSGSFELSPGLTMNCFRLSDGKAVIDAESMVNFFEWLGRGVQTVTRSTTQKPLAPAGAFCADMQTGGVNVEAEVPARHPACLFSAQQDLSAPIAHTSTEGRCVQCISSATGTPLCHRGLECSQS